MSDAAPRYDSSSKCAKCGSSNISTGYREQLDMIMRQCCRCNHTWFEQPVDKEFKKDHE